VLKTRVLSQLKVVIPGFLFNLYTHAVYYMPISRDLSPHRSPHKDVYDTWPWETYRCLSEGEGENAAYEVYIRLRWCANQSVAGDLTLGGCREEDLYEDQ
jgi:hypothetical protein